MIILILIYSDEDPTNWVLLECPDAVKVSLVATGSDGWAGMLAHLDDSKALYGGFTAKVTGLPIQFQFFFQGDNMNPIKRGKTRMVKKGVFGALTDALGEVELEGMGEATVERVYAIINEASGEVGVENIEF